METSDDSKLLELPALAVLPEWIDYNGHLTEGYYGVAFGQASDEVLVHLGFCSEYLEEHGSFYTVESRIRYLREVKEGASIRADSWVLGADAKRIHLHHELRHHSHIITWESIKVGF